ncbi:hypothetical protein PoB_003306400 [Plakobranchus ocellatus]|uniref:Uncharacterized protein n=1 Tax=Plakobranchus ocellatus TaxID=259542 RepID=A0AAV4AFV9_9GAST|nr:hypothetical protein PoB_003306400 [Plakobranchus ocellatus]
MISCRRQNIHPRAMVMLEERKNSGEQLQNFIYKTGSSPVWSSTEIRIYEITLKFVIASNAELLVFKKDQNSVILSKYYHIYGPKLEPKFAPCQHSKKGILEGGHC